MKKYDSCILNKSLIFSIMLFLFFLVNPINAQTYFNPSIGYGGGYGLYGPTSWRTPVADLLAGYGISSYPTGSPYYPYRYQQPYNYSFYHGNPYNPNDPLYGTVPRPPISIPSGLMDILLVSSYDASDSRIRGIVRDFVTNTYIQPAIMSGWMPYGYQQRYYPSYPYPGIPYAPYGNDVVGYP